MFACGLGSGEKYVGESCHPDRGCPESEKGVALQVGRDESVRPEPSADFGGSPSNPFSGSIQFQDELLFLLEVLLT